MNLKEIILFFIYKFIKEKHPNLTNISQNCIKLIIFPYKIFKFDFLVLSKLIQCIFKLVDIQINQLVPKSKKLNSTRLKYKKSMEWRVHIIVKIGNKGNFLSTGKQVS